MTSPQKTRAERIRALLTPLNTNHIIIENTSASHHGHAGDDGSGETHFKITLVSPALAAQPKVVAHRHVLGLLAPEFKSGLHALELVIL